MSLADYWKNPVYETGTFFLQADNIPAKRRGQAVSDFDEYIALLKAGRKSLRKFQPYLRPKPFVGNINKAEIVVTLRNPSYNHFDVKLELESECYQDLLERNLKQDFDHNFSIDPNYCWTPDFSWWEPRLRKLAEHIQSEIPALRSYGDALMLLAKKVAFVELEPYRSISSLDLPSDTESVLKARNWIQHLINSGRNVFIQRADRQWDVHGTGANFGRRTNRNARSAYLTPDSDCGKFILAHIKR